MRLRPFVQPLLPLLLVLLLPFATFAQRVISGRVTAQASKEPLALATVLVDGQPNAAVTDKNGRFSVTVPAEGVSLTFSHLGFQSLTVPVAQLGPEVALTEQTYLIGEVQISYEKLQKLLLREWRIAPASLDVMAQVAIARTRARSEKQAAFLEQNPEALRRVLESARYDFRPDGVVKTKIMLAGTKTSWQLNEDTRTLTLISDDGRQQKIQVVELTADRMVLRPADAGESTITYVPAG